MGKAKAIVSFHVKPCIGFWNWRSTWKDDAPKLSCCPYFGRRFLRSYLPYSTPLTYFSKHSASCSCFQIKPSCSAKNCAELWVWVLLDCLRLVMAFQRVIPALNPSRQLQSKLAGCVQHIHSHPFIATRWDNAPTKPQFQASGAGPEANGAATSACRL